MTLDSTTDEALGPFDARLRALEAAVEHVSEAVMVWQFDDDGEQLVYVNMAFCELSGWARTEVIGRRSGVLVGPASEPGMGQRFRTALFTMGEHREPAVLHRRDGSVFSAALSYVMVRDVDGEPWGAIGVCRDVSDAKRNEQRFRALIENVSDIVSVIDPDGIVRFVSPSIERVLGYSVDAVVGQSVFGFFGRQSGPSLTESDFRRILATSSPLPPVVVTVAAADGSVRPFELLVYNRSDDPAIGGVLVTARDVSDRHAAEQATLRRDEWARAIGHRANDVVVVVDPDGTISYASPSVETVLGWPPAELKGTDWSALVAAVDRERVRNAVAGELVGIDSGPLVVACMHRSGGTRRLRIEADDFRDTEAVRGIVLTARDVTEWTDAEELLSEEAALLESIAQGVEVSTVLSGVSQLIERHLPRAGASVGILEGDGAIRHRTAPSLPRAIIDFLDTTEPSSPLGRMLREAGAHHVMWDDIMSDELWAHARDLVASAGYASCWSLNVHDTATEQLLGCVVVFHADARRPNADEMALLDRSRHLAAIAINHSHSQTRLQQLALHDPLTSLPNRTLLLDRIERALARSRRRRASVGVLFVDLDQFKVINDSLGHAAGDRLLEQVADRIAQAVRADDTVGRFGGDEFVVLCEDVEGEAGAIEVAQRIAAALEPAFTLADAEVVVTASVGIALAEDATSEPGTLIRDADAAMYRAKAKGRNRYALADKDTHRRMVRRLEVERSLRAAIGTDQLLLHYQPQVRLADHTVTGFEALVRWMQPDGSVLGASSVVPVAEETGLIVPLGAWVLHEACQQARAWDDQGLGPLTMCVNISARQLADPALVDAVAHSLGDAGLAPGRLCLEVTESALAVETDATVAVLGRLKELGVRLAIDDFGTGYATLDYVRRFSMADALKIDQSFVAGLTHFHSPDSAIVSAAIVLSDALGFDTVAEGVEGPEQLAVLRRLGCAQAQGFFFGRPMPAADAIAALLDR
jgi:diguanylate cyclase (GGDEF)-like protein/PAS domain S-box-containing protein